ncbi:MAG: hypothetical protein Q8L74_13450 [Nitrospirota bacterium]|nr:hypothetical protein [Nitrospirota bacterium]MDP2383663.1 hypothetical protein [Nitrospirota bacterium]MDP3595872.1 hypothetical protein [Nitrospirota bacterium]
MIATTTSRAFVTTKSCLALVLVLAGLGLSGCSSVRILQPTDGAVLPAGQPILFEGQVTRSSETGGADRSSDLAWESSRDGQLATGQQFTTSTLSAGSHRITANWPGHDRRASIGISIAP